MFKKIYGRLAISIRHQNDVLILFQRYSDSINTWAFGSRTLPIGGRSPDDYISKQIKCWIRLIRDSNVNTTMTLPDLEEYIQYKNKNVTEDYNRIDRSQYNLSNISNIFKNLLEFVKKNEEEYLECHKQFDKFLNLQIRLSKLQLRKSVLLNLLKLFTVESFPNTTETQFGIMEYLLRKKPSRNVSGITSITVITAPFPNGQKFSCKHNCYFCPNEPAHEGNNYQAQPRSYLYKEPAVQRANQHRFKALNQMLNRMDTLFSNGQVVDKLEIIVEGGTFTEYPESYLEEYIRDVFYSANIYRDLRKLYSEYYDSIEILNTSLLSQVRKPECIEREVFINKTAMVHIIGVCIETRPDAIDDKWLYLFRKWGVTRVQLGVQHVDNDILKKINRGHTIERVIWAIQYLKDNCFKIDIHIMPDSPGSSKEKDMAMFDYVYSKICPDQMKVYPCEVVPWTVIEKWYKNGTYTPYFEKNPQDLIDVVRYSMVTCPNWVRLPRVIRDIPSSYIQCGNTIANLRQEIENQFDNENIKIQEIRYREIGRHVQYYKKPISYNVYYKYANNGHDYFICCESFDKVALFGFLRLRIVEKKNLQIFNVLKNKSLVRELHVYGNLAKVGTKTEKGCQHTGIGSTLLRKAEHISKRHWMDGIVVISGEGVKSYYEKNGYYEKETFMVKDFWYKHILYMFVLIFFPILLFHN